MTDEEIVIRLRPVVLKISKSIYYKLPQAACVELDDVISEGWIGAIQAGRSYSPDRGVTLEQFASIRIDGQIRDWFRQQDHLTRGQRKKDPTPAPIHLDAFDDLPITDLSPVCVIEHFESRIVLRKLISRARLDSRSSYIVRSRYLRGVTVEELGSKFNIDATRVSQITKVALSRLNTVYNSKPRVHRTRYGPTITQTCPQCHREFSYPLFYQQGPRSLRFKVRVTFCSKKCVAAHHYIHPRKLTDGTLLRKLYVDEELSMNQVAKRLGVRYGSLYRAFKRFGIKARPPHYPTIRTIRTTPESVSQ